MLVAYVWIACSVCLLPCWFIHALLSHHVGSVKGQGVIFSFSWQPLGMRSAIPVWSYVLSPSEVGWRRGLGFLRLATCCLRVELRPIHYGGWGLVADVP